MSIISVIADSSSATDPINSIAVDAHLVGPPSGVAVMSVGPKGDPGQAGPPGPDGAPGPSEIGGYGFNLGALKSGDMLVFGGDAWTNEHKTEISDGGNF